MAQAVNENTLKYDNFEIISRLATPLLSFKYRIFLWIFIIKVKIWLQRSLADIYKQRETCKCKNNNHARLLDMVAFSKFTISISAVEK